MNSATSKPHVVFMNMAATGHMNPTLPVVSELTARGCKVTYFVEDTMRAVVEAAGATWRSFRYPESDFTGILRNPSDFARLTAAELLAAGVPEDAKLSEYGFPFSLVYNAQLVLPKLLEDLRSLDPPPAVIVYEPFLACARVAAHVLAVPCVSLYTMPGPGVFVAAEKMIVNVESRPWVKQPQQWIIREYGFDLFEQGALMEFYSPFQNLVTTIDTLYAPPASKHQLERFGHFPFKCDGTGAPSLSLGETSAQQQSLTESLQAGEFSTAQLSLDGIRHARSSGKRVVLISLGTVATGRMWNETLPAWSNDDDRDAGTRRMWEYTGKEFCQFVYQQCFEAFGSDPNLLVVVAMGSNGQEALEDLPPVPPNFVLRPAVPQLELLPLLDGFITHGGANSTHEALALGIPLVIVPVFGDQIYIADKVAHCGAGVSFRYPLRTLSVASIRSALDATLQAETGHRDAAQQLAGQLASAGGIAAAVDSILEVVRSHEDTDKPSPRTFGEALPNLLAPSVGRNQVRRNIKPSNGADTGGIIVEGQSQHDAK
eukprot:TRINITY_DN7598_c0_g1_i2.p1 TRINITY_DN7598_c0_g1~~TRINITY_DN7598_c0_g1_i2.p1  ORF type:complete len:543 (+),score=81.60 TRINITY_DN7598_c0_g1_i2:117-1745(+)